MRVRLGCDREVPREQLADPADGVVGDAFEDLVEVDLRIEAVELS